MSWHCTKDSGTHISTNVMTKLAAKECGLYWRQEGRCVASAAMLKGCCRPQTRALLERWRNDMLNTSKAHLITEDGQSNWIVTDQLALTLIFAVRCLFSRLFLHTLQAKYVDSLTDRVPKIRSFYNKLLKLMRFGSLRLDPAPFGVLHVFDLYVHPQESHDLLTEGVEGSRKLVWMYNRSVRVLPLPVLAAMNGHTAFVQELHLR